MKQTKETEIKTLLPNGEWYPAGIDIISIASLRNIRRFSAFNIPDGIRLNVLEHSALCAMMVEKYCDFMYNRFNFEKTREYAETYQSSDFRHKLLTSVLTHDVEEIVINDIPAPVKIPGLDSFKANIRTTIRDFLKVKDNEIHEAVLVGVKQLDIVSAFIEVYLYKDYMNFHEMNLYYKNRIIEMQLEDFIYNLSEQLHTWLVEGRK